ncbi:MAG: hypothetical protein GC168_20270 [Candidatus Hydrogenedens sp.]|nr:hypothetical protein [Candidatus Hydrogenedens sp.]
MSEFSEQPKPVKTGWMYLREGLLRARARRPFSFYLLLAIPVALLAAVNLLENRDSPVQFATTVGLLVAFFGVVMLRAVADVFDITRDHLRGRREVARGTLFQPEFAKALGEKVRGAHDE